jgi:DNA-binding transcriptional MerR regulator
LSANGSVMRAQSTPGATSIARPAPASRCRGSSRAASRVRSSPRRPLTLSHFLRKRQPPSLVAHASPPPDSRCAPPADAARCADVLDRRAGARVRPDDAGDPLYEDCGPLARRAGRSRVYTARDRARLTLTLRGKRLGLKLAEVKELVDMYEPRRDSDAQLRRFLDVLARQRAQLEERLAELRTTLAEVVAQEAAARRVLRARSRA